MAQLLLEKRSLLSLQGKMLAACLAGTLCLTPAGFATDKKKNEPVRIDIPELLLDGGRKLRFERMFSTEQEVKPKKGFWTKVVDVVIGAPDYHTMVRPYSITTDRRGGSSSPIRARMACTSSTSTRKNTNFCRARTPITTRWSSRSAWPWTPKTAST